MNKELVKKLSERMAPEVLNGVRTGLRKALLPIYKEFDEDRELLIPYVQPMGAFYDNVDVAYGLAVPSEALVWDVIPGDRGVLLTLEEFASGDYTGGMGFYATESQYSKLHAYRSAIKAGLVRPEFTHVLWFREGVDYE